MAISWDTTIIAVGVAVLAIVVFFELRYMRSRRKDKIKMVLLRDEAYNALITTSAVSKALKEKKKDTTDADRLIFEAERAYQRRDYSTCKELTDRAREALRQAKSKELEVFEEIASTPAPQEEEPVVPFQEVKKLPVNYIESKFMIESARIGIETANQRGMDTTAARAYLESAQKYFANTEYTEALKYAYKAKRCAEGQAVERLVTAEKKGTEEELKPQSVEEEKCPQCGASIRSVDNFCGKCGAKIIRIPKCPSCSAEVDPSDNFCRRCGTKLKEP